MRARALIPLKLTWNFKIINALLPVWLFSFILVSTWANAEEWISVGQPPLGPYAEGSANGVPAKLGGVIQILPDGSTVYAATANGLYQRKLTGEPWEKINLPIEYPVQSISVSDTHVLIIPQSVWGLPDPGDTLFILEKASGAILQTELPSTLKDGSSIRSCTLARSGGAGNALILGNYCESSPGTTIASKGSLLKSIDGGLSWTSIAPTGIGFVNSVSTLDGERIYIIAIGPNSSAYGMYRSDDGGETWTDGWEITYARQIYQKSHDEIFIYAQLNIRWSNDGGESMNVMQLPGNLSGLEGMAFGRLQTEIGVQDVTYFSAANRGVFRTTDMGESWEWISSGAGINNSVLAAVGADTEGSTDLLTGADAFTRFDRYDPDKASWNHFNEGLGTSQVHEIVSLKNRLYALVRSSGIYRSADLGRTWTMIGRGLNDFENNFYYRNGESRNTPMPAETITSTGSTLITTHKAGAMILPSVNSDTWQKSLPLGDMPSPHYVYGAYSDGDTTIVLGNVDARLSYVSQDDGLSWDLRDGPGMYASCHFGSFALNGSSLYMAGSEFNQPNSLNLTCDSFGKLDINSGERTGLVDLLPTNRTRDVVVTDLGDVYVALETKGVYKTSNDGASFQSANSGLINKNVLSLHHDGKALFAGTDGGVFRLEDGQSSWVQSPGVPLGLWVRDFSVGPEGIFAATDEGLFFLESDEKIIADISVMTAVSPELDYIEYVIQNNGPDDVPNAVFFHRPETGVKVTSVTCRSTSGGASCSGIDPAVNNGSGEADVLLPVEGSVTLRLEIKVSGDKSDPLDDFSYVLFTDVPIENPFPPPPDDVFQDGFESTAESDPLSADTDVTINVPGSVAVFSTLDTKEGSSGDVPVYDFTTTLIGSVSNDPADIPLLKFLPPMAGQDAGADQVPDTWSTAKALIILSPFFSSMDDNRYESFLEQLDSDPDGAVSNLAALIEDFNQGLISEEKLTDEIASAWTATLNMFFYSASTSTQQSISEPKSEKSNQPPSRSLFSASLDYKDGAQPDEKTIGISIDDSYLDMAFLFEQYDGEKIRNFGSLPISGYITPKTDPSTLPDNKIYVLKSRRSNLYDQIKALLLPTSKASTTMTEGNIKEPFVIGARGFTGFGILSSEFPTSKYEKIRAAAISQNVISVAADSLSLVLGANSMISPTCYSTIQKALFDSAVSLIKKLDASDESMRESQIPDIVGDLILAAGGALLSCTVNSVAEKKVVEKLVDVIKLTGAAAKKVLMRVNLVKDGLIAFHTFQRIREMVSSSTIAQQAKYFANDLVLISVAKSRDFVEAGKYVAYRMDVQNTTDFDLENFGIAAYFSNADYFFSSGSGWQCATPESDLINCKYTRTLAAGESVLGPQVELLAKDTLPEIHLNCSVYADGFNSPPWDYCKVKTTVGPAPDPKDPTFAASVFTAPDCTAATMQTPSTKSTDSLSVSLSGPNGSNTQALLNYNIDETLVENQINGSIHAETNNTVTGTYSCGPDQRGGREAAEVSKSKLEFEVEFRNPSLACLSYSLQLEASTLHRANAHGRVVLTGDGFTESRTVLLRHAAEFPGEPNAPPPIPPKDIQKQSKPASMGPFLVHPGLFAISGKVNLFSGRDVPAEAKMDIKFTVDFLSLENCQ